MVMVMQLLVIMMVMMATIMTRMMFLSAPSNVSCAVHIDTYSLQYVQPELSMSHESWNLFLKRPIAHPGGGPKAPQQRAVLASNEVLFLVP